MIEYSELDKALQFAAKAHSGQMRDGEHALPYAIHPFEVVTNLRYVGGVTSERLLTAAALHDVLEETDVKPSRIKERFGGRVLELVKELTRKEPKKKDTEGMTEEEIWQLRSSMLLTEIAKMSREAQTVKLADRLSNLREANLTRSGERLERYRVQSYEILETVPEEVNAPLWNAIKRVLAER
jgi:(p)ppGpp synthase/HD superfamily hydrolase